jgi:chemosensory pili system protein ChpC
MTRRAIDRDGVADLVTMLLPVRGRNLLVPNVSVAEIVQLGQLEPSAEAAGWLLGLMQWRGLQIPVVSFESLNDDPFASDVPARRAAVCNGCLDPQRLPFFGIVTGDTPRMIRISADEIVACDHVVTGPAERMAVSASGEEASIPNLAFIEEQLLLSLAGQALAEPA